MHDTHKETYYHCLLIKHRKDLSGKGGLDKKFAGLLHEYGTLQNIWNTHIRVKPTLFDETHPELLRTIEESGIDYHVITVADER